jgi:two-component system, OmpR family, sensor histidine kinase BaeS
MRKRFMRRMGCLFVIIVIAIIIFGILLANGVIGHRISENPHSIFERIPIVFRVISWILFSMLIIALLYLGSYFRKAAVPISKILEASGKIADGDYSVRIKESGPNDLQALSRAFNNMADKLQVNDEQRRRMLADVSHELRTPLTVIQGNLEGMLDGIYEADERNIQAVLDETRIMERVIEDLRLLAVVESGSLKLQLERVDVCEFLEEIIPTYQALAETKQVSVKLICDDDLPEIDMDATRMREVVSNMVTNALRYCEAGGEISISCEQRFAENTKIWFAVSDTGSGISAEDLPHIFERFYKGSDSSGTGLGLPIAKSLVEAHGGEIFIESEVGKGTTIRFYLPWHNE